MSTKPLAKQVVPGKGGAESARAASGAVRPRDSLFHWCGTADAIQQTSNRSEKRALLEAYFGAVAANTVAPAARFFSGGVLPRHDARSIAVDERLVAATIRELTRTSVERFEAFRVQCGDLGAAAAEVFSGRLPSGLSVNDVEHWLDDLADRPTAPVQAALLRGMIARLSAMEAKYVVRMIDGGLKIALDGAIMEEALANAFAEPVAAVRRAVLRHGDLGIVAQLARWHALDTG